MTSSVAEQNRRSWEPYLRERAMPELNLGWHVVFESTAKATYGGRKGHPRFKDALTVVSPALWVGCLLDQTHVLHWDHDTGWTRYPLPNPLPIPRFPGCP
ncbi:hypothetical protein ABZ454_35885 [Streptomyces sp. NPDC005803]|uniref:hypothetical protein n=1 Tax=Streptomyces sp. NPDC005803 TaxID=3154297 RepID=UPI0033FA8A5F